MSASIERVFSSTNIIISDRRNQLIPNAIEVIKSLKSWQKIKGGDTRGSVVYMPWGLTSGAM
jgi:hypothetical protein